MGWPPRALVIGNNAYSEVPNLEKAIGDAQAISAYAAGPGLRRQYARRCQPLSACARAHRFRGPAVMPGDTALLYSFAGTASHSTAATIYAD
jgi:hypothetical protein